MIVGTGTRRAPGCPDRSGGFTLIELLVVVGIISLLISILMPSLNRARDQAKSVHCLARLHDYANALSAYENVYQDRLPEALWYPGVCCEHDSQVVRYGWQERLFEYVYKEVIFADDPDCSGGGASPDFPTQRNLDKRRWADYFICKASVYDGVNAGHYRVYLPFWSFGTFQLRSDGTFDETTGPNPEVSPVRASLRPKMFLISDSNEESHRGDGDPSDVHRGDDCSYVDAGEADIGGPNGNDGNRISDRHYGGTNYLFQDFHAEWRTDLRARLARDWDLNGIIDVEEGL